MEVSPGATPQWKVAAVAFPEMCLPLSPTSDPLAPVMFPHPMGPLLGIRFSSLSIETFHQHTFLSMVDTTQRVLSCSVDLLYTPTENSEVQSPPVTLNSAYPTGYPVAQTAYVAPKW